MEPMYSKYPGSPWDNVPDAPEECVVCNLTFPVEKEDGEVICHPDGVTCSEKCHEKWLQKEMQHRKEEQKSLQAMAEYYAEMARAMGEGE